MTPLRTRTLVQLRWMTVFGQTAAVLVTGVMLRLPIPFGPCFALIGASAAMNIAIALSPAAHRTLKEWELTAQLALDVLQISGLLYFTGGVANPFCLFLLAPTVLGASHTSLGQSLALGLLAVGLAGVLAVDSWPMPWAYHRCLQLPVVYRAGHAFALGIGIAFSAGYAFYAAREEMRMGLALHVTERVLAREQRLSALGGLAAAAAHELGTPLATISVVAKELAREVPEGPLREDAWLLVDQARRCRDILRRLAETPEAGDNLHERMSLLQLVREVLSDHAGAGAIRAEAVVTGPPGIAAPDLWRRPEILHAITAIVDNAFDFARAEILVTARFDARTITVEVRDDGAGISSEVMSRLGEPYVTTRPGAEGSRTGHVGMGLGFFIAKTLLERSGAEVRFGNGRPSGAIVSARWPRSLMEAREPESPGLEPHGDQRHDLARGGSPVSSRGPPLQ